MLLIVWKVLLAEMVILFAMIIFAEKDVMKLKTKKIA